MRWNGCGAEERRLGANSGADPDKGVPEAVERLTREREGAPIGKLCQADDKQTWLFRAVFDLFASAGQQSGTAEGRGMPEATHITQLQYW